MNRHLWLLASGCFWAAMMFLLFEREIKPYFEYQQPPTYKSILRDKRDTEAERRAILFTTDRIGEVESILEPLEGGGAVMKSRMMIRMQPLMNIEMPDDRSFVSREVRVDGSFQMTKFSVEARLHGIRLTISGERRDDKLHVSYNMLLFKGEQTVDFPKDAIFSDNFLPYLGGARLAEGKKWRLRMLDFDNLFSLKGGSPQLSFTDVYAVVSRREAIRHSARDLQVFKVDVKKNPNDDIPLYELWVDDAGTVLRQRMMVSKQQCTVILEERRALTAAEAAAYSWSVPLPSGKK